MNGFYSTVAVTLCILLFAVILINRYKPIEGFTDLTTVNLVDTYVINLDRSPDRLKDMTKLAQERGFQFKRWPAVDGRKLTKEELRAKGATYWSLKDLTKKRHGEFGAFLSHQTLWKHLSEKSVAEDPAYLVLEDDILLGLDFKTKLANLLKRTPSDWDVLLLGYLKPTWIGTPEEGEFTKISTFWGVYAYVIRGSTLKRILPYFDTIGEPIDTLMERYGQNGKLNIYAVSPPLVNTGNSPSTILN
jgi:glycosyl transferase family 25